MPAWLGCLMDLGISSPQIDNPVRGFSFRFDGPLDMRMDPTRGESVAEWLATAEVQQIAEVVRDYGEERFAGPIAKAIVARRQERGPDHNNYAELADLVAGTVKTREAGPEPRHADISGFSDFHQCRAGRTATRARCQSAGAAARWPPGGDQLSTRWKTALSSSSSPSMHAK